MDDDPDAMLRQTILICALFWLPALALVFLSGCTPTATVNHELPQLDRIGQAVQKIVAQDCQRQRQTLAMPPIPQECLIDIRGDTVIASSQECEDLIRYYSRARRLLKPAAPHSSRPTTAP